MSGDQNDIQLMVQLRVMSNSIFASRLISNWVFVLQDTKPSCVNNAVKICPSLLILPSLLKLVRVFGALNRPAKLDRDWFAAMLPGERRASNRGVRESSQGRNQDDSSDVSQLHVFEILRA